MFPHLRTVALCRAAALPWVQKPHENQAVVVLRDSSPINSWIAAARHINAEFPIDRIVAMADLDQDKAAVIAEDLGIDFYPVEVVEWVHNKLGMRARLDAAGLENFAYHEPASAEDALDFFDAVGPPLIFKPSRGRASAGVTVVTERDQVAISYHKAAMSAAPRVEPSKPIAERYFAGPEYSVECLSHEGQHYVFAVTEKLSDAESKVEYGHVIPARISADDEAALIRHVRACLTALGITHGITHNELIFGAAGPVFLETHLRQAGDEIPHLIVDSTGLDMADFFLRQVAGEDISALPELRERKERPQYVSGAAIHYLIPPKSGTLQRIDGWDEVAGRSGVQACAPLVGDGSQLKGLESSYSRLGYVRVKDGDGSRSLALVQESVALLTVHATD